MKSEKVSVVSNPIIEQALSVLRSKKSDILSFRRASSQIVPGLIMEASKSFSQKEIVVETPIEETKSKIIEKDIVIVPILRAGLSMVESAMALLPSAKVGYIGVKRDEKTALAREYYANVPECKDCEVLVLDPMLATGGTSIHSVKHIMQQNPSSVTMVCMIAAPEGIKKFQEEFPEVKIVSASIDNKLNEQKFICPGLGDFGDRFNGTI